jgi:hypothetical protein
MKTILAALLIPAFAQEDRAEKLWRFKAGTQWTYQLRNAGGPVREIARVVGEKDGRVIQEVQSFKEGEAQASETYRPVAWFEKGFVLWGREKDGKVSAENRVWKAGARKGDTWPFLFAETSTEITAEFMGEIELKTPAGTWKQVRHVRITSGKATEQELYLAEGAGLLKLEVPGGPVIELAAFAPAK